MPGKSHWGPGWARESCARSWGFSASCRMSSASRGGSRTGWRPRTRWACLSPILRCSGVRWQRCAVDRPNSRVIAPPARTSVDLDALVTPRDQRLDHAAARTLGRRAEHGGVAGHADRPDRPTGADRLGPAAAGARLAGAMTLEAGGADRLALFVAAGAGADPAADRTGRVGALVAAVTEVRLPVARVAGDALEVSAPTAKPAAALSSHCPGRCRRRLGAPRPGRPSGLTPGVAHRPP